ncbi:MAG: hypothetical protein LBP75_01615 [Planctomycetota bacterium]|jgi:hypothetical protein|nr:hypothetical protein [Planctomycetota bacterium]
MLNAEKDLESRISRRLLLVFIAGCLGIALVSASAASAIFDARDKAVEEIRQEQMDALQAIERARQSADSPRRNAPAPNKSKRNFL